MTDQSRTPRTTGELVLQHAALPGIARGSTSNGMRLLELGGTTHYAAGNIYLSALCVINHLQNEAADLRERLAGLTMSLGFATGHGDTAADILKELEWQLEERLAKAREEAIEECARECDKVGRMLSYGAGYACKIAAKEIRALKKKGADHE